jgi:hypothetical protein
MKANWEQTDNLLGMKDLALITLFNPCVGTIGRWFCPPQHRIKLAERVRLFEKTLGTDYEVRIYTPRC